jgi:hypothetical protein
MNVHTPDTKHNRRMPSYLLSVDGDSSWDTLAAKYRRDTQARLETAYEITRDPGLLHQYYLLRDNLFIHLWGMEKGEATEDAFDTESDIVIARVGRHCIGGGRLTVSKPRGRKALPMEGEGFTLAEALPMLEKETYGEVSRFAILPELQNSAENMELSCQLMTQAADKGVHYLFMLAPARTVAQHNKAASLLGLKWQVRSDIEIADREAFDGIKMELLMLDLSPLTNRKAKKASKLLAIAD